MTDLKLIALDGEDLAALSAHCQDAVLRVGDIVYQPRAKRLALLCNRFNWAALEKSSKRKMDFERRRAGLRFERVLKARFSGFDPTAADRVLVLLAIVFEPTDEPAGEITLQFAGDAAIRLDVECIETELRDVGAAWSTLSKPEHTLDEAAPKPETPTDKP